MNSVAVTFESLQRHPCESKDPCFRKQYNLEVDSRFRGNDETMSCRFHDGIRAMQTPSCDGVTMSVILNEVKDLFTYTFHFHLL